MRPRRRGYIIWQSGEEAPEDQVVQWDDGTTITWDDGTEVEWENP